MFTWYMNDERQQMVDIAREFAQTELRPAAAEVEATDKLPMELYQRAAELGFLGAWYPEEYGGFGLGWTTYCLINEEIAKELPVLTILMGGSANLGGGIIFHGGTEEQKKYWIPKIISGEVVTGGSNTEATGCNNYFDMAGNARLEGDEWVINANKIFTTSAEVATHMLVSVRTDEFDPKTLMGVSWFIVPMDAPGVELGKIEHKLGWHGSSTGSIFFNDVHIPKENLIGPEPHRGMHQIFPTLTTENLMVGVEMLAQAETLYQKSWDYAHERMHHGKSIFDSYQVIRHKLVDMRMNVDTLRAFVYSTAAEIDNGHFPLVDGRLCKIKGVEILDSVAKDAIAIHGGNGVIADNGIERPYRDVRVSSIAGGTIEFLKENVIDVLEGGMESVL